MVPCIQEIGWTDYVPEGVTCSLIHAQRKASCGVRTPRTLLGSSQTRYLERLEQDMVGRQIMPHRQMSWRTFVA